MAYIQADDNTSEDNSSDSDSDSGDFELAATNTIEDTLPTYISYKRPMTYTAESTRSGMLLSPSLSSLQAHTNIITVQSTTE